MYICLLVFFCLFVFLSASNRMNSDSYNYEKNFKRLLLRPVLLCLYKQSITGMDVFPLSLLTMGLHSVFSSPSYLKTDMCLDIL